MHLAAFIAEHNLPYTVMEHLPNLIQKVCPDSKIALKLKCGRTKTESIVTNVIGAVGNNNVIELMKKNKFSIILDESTDRSTIKHMAVIARIVDPNLLVRDEFVTLIEVEKATADALYELVTNFFIKNKIPFKENMNRLCWRWCQQYDGQTSFISYQFDERCARFVHHEMHLSFFSPLRFLCLLKIATLYRRFC